MITEYKVAVRESEGPPFFYCRYPEPDTADVFDSLADARRHAESLAARQRVSDWERRLGLRLIDGIPGRVEVWRSGICESALYLSSRRWKELV